MIDRRWLPLNALRAFESVGRHLSVTAASQALSVSQSAVSRHVISLEGLLGTPLFERRPQQLVLTEAGAALLPVVRKSLDRIEQALNDIVNDTGARRVRGLRVVLPPSFAQLLAVPILREFRATFPDVVLEIESVNTVGPSTRDADAAVIYSRPQVGQYVASLLWMERLTPICHPHLLARYGAADMSVLLTEAELLHVKLQTEGRYHLWQMFASQSGLSIDVERGLVFDTAALAAQYALSGEGVALLDRQMFAPDIAQGRLVAPFDAMLEGGYGYYITVQPEDLADPAIAAFRAWMIQRFGVGTTRGEPAADTPRLRMIEGSGAVG